MSQFILLFFLIAFSLVNQWGRWLPVYVSTVSLPECESLCNETVYTPVCTQCLADDESCSNCQACKLEYNSTTYNMLDGLCLSTEEFGVITGLGFSVTFGVFGLVAGCLVDYYVDAVLTILGVSTLICGLISLLSCFVTGYKEILILRAALGLVQAFGAPATSRIATKYFPKESDRPIPNGCYVIGIYLGLGCAALSTAFSSIYGWRQTFGLLATVTLLLAFIFEMLFDVFGIGRGMGFGSRNEGTTEEKRSLLTNPQQQSYQQRGMKTFAAVSPALSQSQISASERNHRSSLEIQQQYPRRQSGEERYFRLPWGNRYYINARWLVIAWHLFAAATRFTMGPVLLVYIPVVVSRKFPQWEFMFSALNAAIFVVCGCLGSFTSSFFTRYLIHQHGYSSVARFIAWTCLLCAPLYLAAFRTDSFWAMMLLLSLGYLIGEGWLGASFTLLQGLSPVEYQGSTLSVYYLLNWITSAAVLDILGRRDPGNSEMERILAISFFVVILASSICFFILSCLIKRKKQNTSAPSSPSAQR